MFWSSAPNAVNRKHDGQLMDAGFRFELGVFTEPFAPTSANTTSWAANWKPVQRLGYDVGEKRYFGEFTPEDNVTPFTEGKPVYVWGFNGNAVAGDWILFRAADWTFPNAFTPFNYQWFAQTATCVVGSINPAGNPFLMQSAAVTLAAPPTTTWVQWQAEALGNEPLNGPNDDPDKDSVSNLLEFVFGTPPKSAGAPPLTQVALVGGHLQITIPRRIDHQATLVVEVSSNMTSWNSGTNETEVVANGLTTLIVRDKTPFAPPLSRRFMRLRASLP
jgi:hypothetical protein